jgi:hypothetical protein
MVMGRKMNRNGRELKSIKAVIRCQMSVQGEMAAGTMGLYSG